MENAVFEFSLQQQWAQGKNGATQGKTEGKKCFYLSNSSFKQGRRSFCPACLTFANSYFITKEGVSCHNSPIENSPTDDLASFGLSFLDINERIKAGINYRPIL